ncbi:MAG TPA: hypothetical protein VMS64_03405 [Candidatus Methylomirabilis sp.]|nr:hypothetical protein [Candidatus Methylomirabilis sp.]
MLIALGLIGMLVRMTLWATWTPTSTADTATYVDMAHVMGTLYSSRYLGVRPPGYSLLLLLGGLDFTRIWVLQSLLGVAISLMIYSLAYSQTKSSGWALVAGLAHSLNLSRARS